MEMMKEMLALFTNLPATISVIMSVATLVIVWWIHIKKIDIEVKSTSSVIQDRQIQSLMNQIRLLSEELDKSRVQLAEVFTQNRALMVQLQEANMRIGELERLIEKTSHTVHTMFPPDVVE